MSVVIDDFGIGYLLFVYLKRFVFDMLKIDVLFVCDLDVGSGD